MRVSTEWLNKDLFNQLCLISEVVGNGPLVEGQMLKVVYLKPDQADRWLRPCEC